MHIYVKKLRESATIPEIKTPGSAGYDLTACMFLNDKFEDEPHTAAVVLRPHEMVKVATGIAVAIEHGYVGDVRPRSGLAIKHGVTVINTPGTIDADYRGEIVVGLINLSDQIQEIHIGDRIAQLVITKCETPELNLVEELPPYVKYDESGNNVDIDSIRGSNGFGSTGK